MDTEVSSADIRTVIEPLHRGKFWMQLLAVVSILYGVLLALTIVGLIVAWIPIWAGVVLMQASGASSRAFQSGDALEMKHAMGKLKTYFTIVGVLMLISITVMVVSMIFGIGAGLMGMESLMQ